MLSFVELVFVLQVCFDDHGCWLFWCVDLPWLCFFDVHDGVLVGPKYEEWLLHEEHVDGCEYFVGGG